MDQRQRHAPCVVWLVAIVVCGCGKTESTPSPGKPPPENARSALYTRFDEAKLLERFGQRLESPTSGSSQRNLILGDTGEFLKRFTFSGTVTPEKLDRLLRELKEELVQLTGASGATLSGQVQETVEEGKLRGFQFQYREGPIGGSVRVTSKPLKEGSGFEVQCSIQEKTD